MTKIDLNYAQPTPVPPPNMVSTSIRMILSLLVIIALIYLLVYILKRYSYSSSTGGTPLIKVISFSYLRPKEALYLVRVGEKLLLLGVTSNSINLIKELDDSDFDIEFSENLEKTEKYNIKTVAEELKRTFGRKR